MANVITIRSENINQYPNNFFNATVDNDFSPERTVVVPNTYFPYVVEFKNCPAADGKRYVSSWVFDKVSDEYTRTTGKLLYTMEKGLSVFPYLTLDYEIFRSVVSANRELETQTPAGEPITEYKFYGVDTDDFDNVPPEYLLQWLDFPVKDGEGNPIPTMPSLLNYYYTTVKDITIELVKKPNKFDFYENEYRVTIEHNENPKILFSSDEEFNLILSKFNFAAGPFSRLVTYQKLKNISTGPKSVTDIVNKASTLEKVLTGINQFQANLGSIQSKLALATFGLTFAKKAYKKAIDIEKLYIKPLRKKNTKKSLLRSEVDRLKGKAIAAKLKATDALSEGAQKLKDTQEAILEQLTNTNLPDIKDQAGKLKSLSDIQGKVDKLKDSLSSIPSKLNSVTTQVSAASDKVLSLAQEGQQKLLKVQADVTGKLDSLKTIDKQVLQQNLIRIIMNTDLNENIDDVPPLPDEIVAPNIDFRAQLSGSIASTNYSSIIDKLRSEREQEYKLSLEKEKEEAAQFAEKRKQWLAGASVEEINASDTKKNRPDTATQAKVKKWQQTLQSAGLYKGKIDGIWGPLTQTAYEAYQLLKENTTTKPSQSKLTEYQILADKQGYGPVSAERAEQLYKEGKLTGG